MLCLAPRSFTLLKFLAMPSLRLCFVLCWLLAAAGSCWAFFPTRHGARAAKFGSAAGSPTADRRDHLSQLDDRRRHSA